MGSFFCDENGLVDLSKYTTLSIRNVSFLEEVGSWAFIGDDDELCNLDTDNEMLIDFQDLYQRIGNHLLSNKVLAKGDLQRFVDDAVGGQRDG